MTEITCTPPGTLRFGSLPGLLASLPKRALGADTKLKIVDWPRSEKVASKCTMGTVRIVDEFGPFLLGRPIGAKIRERYFAGPDAEWPDEIDFTGVKQATESCLDEIFGVLARRVGAARVTGFRIVHATGEVRDALDYVFDLIRDPPGVPSKADIERILGRRSTGRRRRSAAG
jgi:hypothetical protein